MNKVGSSRSRELRQHLAQKFELDETTVSAALMALIGSIHDRLSRSVEVSLVSWIPETWGFLNADGRGIFEAGVRGVDALQERVAAAGVPESQVHSFIGEIVSFISRRCGRPLAESIRRRVPELSAFESSNQPAAVSE